LNGAENETIPDVVNKYKNGLVFNTCAGKSQNLFVFRLQCTRTKIDA